MIKIEKVNIGYDAMVYHVEYEGCIQEFWTLKSAEQFVDYVNNELKN